MLTVTSFNQNRCQSFNFYVLKQLKFKAMAACYPDEVAIYSRTDRILTFEV